MKNPIFLSILMMCLALSFHAQCPVITCPATCTISCNAAASVTATSNYSANIISSWFGPGNIPLYSQGTATSVIEINATASPYNYNGATDTYTVVFTDTLSGCIVKDTVLAISQSTAPAFVVAANTFTQFCSNSPVNLQIFAGTQPVGGGPVLFAFNSVSATPVFSTANTFTVNTCGIYVASVKDIVNTSCQASSYTISIGCSTLSQQPITITGGGTVCAGSGSTLTASGATYYAWSNGASGPSITITPSSTVIYTVLAQGPGTCDQKTVSVGVNTACAIVWPGDANSDGIVNNTDVLELGLAANLTGPQRTPGSNNYTGQYASVWSGSGTNNQNHCHADCNGDGTVTIADTAAIFLNYSLTHGFKAIDSGANNSLAIISPPEVYGGEWNKADIYLGSAGNPVSNLAGIAFQVNADANMIENNSLYLVYDKNSFLNSGGQNFEFKKAESSAGVIYAANVRTNNSEVSGQGKIAEVWFRLRSDLSAGSPFNISVTDISKVSVTGSFETLSGNSVSPLINNTYLGIKEDLMSGIPVYPIPAENVLYVKTDDQEMNYSITDLTQRKLAEGNIADSGINVAEFAPGVYLLHLSQENRSATIKFVVSRP